MSFYVIEIESTVVQLTTDHGIYDHDSCILGKFSLASAEFTEKVVEHTTNIIHINTHAMVASRVTGKFFTKHRTLHDRVSEIYKG